MSSRFAFWRRLLAAIVGCLLLLGGLLQSAHAEAMLQLFNVSYAEITKRMPELAEAGYGSLWLPPPTKGSGGLSVGYDMWDPFDLGSKDQRSTVRTRYGTEAELLKLVETAHRFGIRIYFDNIMNHRAFDIPGYNETTPTGGEGQAELYPGLVPEDFHLRKTEDGFYRKWDNTRDWNSAWQVQNLGLSDLIDIAHETPNANFGMTEGSTHPKYSFVRDLERPAQYDKDKDGNQAYFGVLIDQARAELGAGATDEEVRLKARSYIVANRTPFIEDVGGYLIRAARWEMDRTKADGLRLDAVKHVPDYFFGMMSGANKDSSDAGYLGQVQWQFNRTRGFSDANHRDSVFDEKKGRDDAMVFGEHLGQPPGYSGYWDAGMRLVDNELRSKLNGVLGNQWAGLQGLDSPGGGGFATGLGVTHANSHDNDYAAQKEWQHAFYMTREGMGLIYSDGYYQAETLGESGGAFPRHANTQYLGQYSDPRIPNILKIHNDLARGLQEGKWSDGDYLAFERRDNRDKFGTWRNGGTASEEVTMVAMFNDNTAQGQARNISTSFSPGAYLYQYAEGPNGSYQVGFYKYAWELGSVVVPPGGYYVFGWRTPELSTLWPNAAITLYQDGAEVPRMTVTRKDGPDGDVNFNPYNLPNRGYPAGTTPEDYSYQTTVPVVKGGPLTILARADGSAENILIKLDGGVDLNGTPISDPGKRDHQPGVYSDVWAGYEQPLFVERQNPEKFAAVNTTRNQTGSPGAETYIRTIGGGGTVNEGPANANNFSTEGGNVAGFLYHDPSADVGGVTTPPKQFEESGPEIVIWAKSNSVGDGFKMFVYYTTDGSFPEGAGGIGRGTTKVAQLNWRHDQTGSDPGAWWGSASIPKPAVGTTFTYKIGVYRGGAASWWPSGPSQVTYKKKMLSTFRVENFNPGTAQFFPHNDYARKPDSTKSYDQWTSDMQTGLSEGFHVVRGRAFLNRNPNTATPLYQTFTQTFYYDAVTPTGQLLYPAANGDTVGGSSYEFVIRTDSTVEEVWFHIADDDAGNNDSVTKVLNGNDTGFEPFVDANQDGIWQAGEKFTDINGNGTYDASLAQGWGQATNSTSINLPDGQKEWRFRYNNIPSSGTASVSIRLLEASSSRNLTLDPTTAHVNEIVRTVATCGPDERVMIAWPQRDGDKVDDNYTMKVYFTQALADGTTAESLKQRFTFSIASTESGTDRDAVVQSRDNFQINYNVNGYHELAIPLPNLYNDVPDFLHTLKVVYTFPDNRTLDAVRLVKANPSSKPFVRVTRPTEVGSDGKQTEIILPDGPGADQLLYTVRVEATASVPDNGLVLTGQPAITLFEEPFNDANANGKWDDIEPSTDVNGNGVWDPTDTYTDVNTNNQWDIGEPLIVDHDGDGVWDAGEAYTDVNKNNQFDTGENFADLNGNDVRDPAETFTDTNGNGTREGTKITVNGNTKTWDFTWKITAPGNYLLTATANLNNQSTSTVRNARVLQRQIVDADLTTDNDDDHDGLIDINETNKKDLPEGNAETWTNGDVHIWYASGQSLPTSPDSDGDGLPDGLEVGWRVAANPPTDPTKDTNLDGVPNFRGDLDPPLYAVVENYSYVPGVGSQSQGDNRTRQAAGSVTDPSNPDTDNDGIPDGVEDASKDGWTDGDGKIMPFNADRAQYATARPAGGDWPNNTIDSWETWTETSPTKGDSDGDNLLDGYGEDKNFNGYIDGDTNKNRQHDSGEKWSETDPLKSDTDGDGLPDGWEVQYGLDALDDGNFSKRLDGQGNIDNGPAGNPDGDLANNLQELNSGTNPTRDDRIPPVTGEGSINIGTFTGWNHNDLLVLDEYNENPSNGGGDVYRWYNSDANSLDILSFSFRDGGDLEAGGDGMLYFRVDLMDLAANAWEGEVDAYIVIDTGNPGAGERSIPNEIDIATDMKWEVVVGAYGQNFGTIFVDRNSSANTTTQYQNPVTDGGVEARAFTGDNKIAWSSTYDAVEIAIERRHLKDAGWLGNPDTLNFQVFTTKPNTTGAGAGDLPSRNDIRDTIYDDWVASDYWKDQDSIILNGKLSSYFSRSGANDRNKSAKVMLLAHGNQAIQPASVTQKLVHDGAATNPAGYFRLLKTHEDYKAPLTLHLTPTLASALQWASNPTPGAANDGPSFNVRVASLVDSNRIDLAGSTFADHVPKYFLSDFNNSNKTLAEQFLDTIYGANAASRSIFWAPERVLDDESLAIIYNMGYRYTFADQMRHFLKWFGRTPALGTEGYRINEVNGMKIFPIHDVTSAYLDQTLDGGSSLPVRQLLSRRSRSDVQDQVAVLWRDMGDFATDAKATSYDSNVRWLASRPWIRVVTAQQIADGQVSYKGLDGNTHTTWGTINRGTGQNLVQTAKDWVDHATEENYDHWYFGSDKEQGLKNQKFGSSAIFGQIGVEGHANEAWNAANSANLALRPNLHKVAGAVIHGAMFQTAFHNTSNNDLSKFSTGDYIYPDTDAGQTLTDFARNTQAQARFAKVYDRVEQWAANAAANGSLLAATAEEVDLDGASEYLLYNSRIFAVFEKKGGRLTAAWLRDPSTGNIWQVAGNFASYSGTDTEDEGASNFVGTTTTVNAYRTSGFKDWWAITGANGSNTAVNADYTVTPAASGTGWTFSQGGISKTITLADASTGKLTATYSLSGPDKLYVRFGLAPNLLDLMLHGQADLQSSEVKDGVTTKRLNLVNNSTEGPVRAFVETSSGSSINTGATDVAAGFTTVNMRNQAQTQQVEVEITGSTTVTLGFDQGDNPDTDGDGLPDSWENSNFGNLGQTGSGDADGDGLTNLQEYVFGTNPTSASSAWRPAVVNDGSGFQVTFPTVVGRSYTLKYRDEIASGTWTSVTNTGNGQANPVTGDGTSKTVTDTGSGSATKRFYRVEASVTTP